MTSVFFFFFFFIIFFNVFFLSLLLQCNFANSTLLSLLSFSYFITPYDAQASSAFSALIMFCAIFSNSSHLGIPNCKKIQQIHTRNILAQRWINFNQWVLRYCHFRVYASFSNSHWRPSWIVNLHKYEIVPFRDHCDQI